MIKDIQSKNNTLIKKEESNPCIDEEVKSATFSVSNSKSNNKLADSGRKSMTSYVLKNQNEQLKQLEKYSPVKKGEDSKILDDDLLEKIESMKPHGVSKSMKYKPNNNQPENNKVITLLPLKPNSSNYLVKSQTSNSTLNENISFSEGDTINLTNSQFNNYLSNNDLSGSNSFKKLNKIKEIKEEDRKLLEGPIIKEEKDENSHNSVVETKNELNITKDLISLDEHRDRENKTQNPVHNINVTLNTTNIILNKTDKLNPIDDLAILQQLISISLSKDISKLVNSSQASNSKSTNSEHQKKIDNILKHWQYGEMIKKQKSPEKKPVKEKFKNFNEKKAKTENIKKDLLDTEKVEVNLKRKYKSSKNTETYHLLHEINQDKPFNERSEYLSEEETFIRFNKRGWICNSCANFNYETRAECNRCKKLKDSRKKYFDRFTGAYVETKKELTANKAKNSESSSIPGKINKNYQSAKCLQYNKLSHGMNFNHPQHFNQTQNQYPQQQNQINPNHNFMSFPNQFYQPIQANNQLRNQFPVNMPLYPQQNIAMNPPNYYPTYMNNQFQAYIHNNINPYLISQIKKDGN